MSEAVHAGGDDRSPLAGLSGSYNTSVHHNKTLQSDTEITKYHK